MTPFIFLRQQREERTSRFPDGSGFPHTIVDFVPLRDAKGEPLTFICRTPEEALAVAKLGRSTSLIAVQSLSEYLACHQKPKSSQHSPKPSAPRPGR